MNNNHQFILPALIFSVAVGVLGLGFVAFGQTTSWFGGAPIDPGTGLPYPYGFYLDPSHANGVGVVSGGLIVNTGGAATGLRVEDGLGGALFQVDQGKVTLNAMQYPNGNTQTAGSNRIMYDTPGGSYTFKAPQGITKVYVTMEGGGGGGGARNAGLRGGGGGGTCAFIQYPLFPLTPGNNYTIFVGSGGAGGVNGVLTGDGDAGTSSTISGPGVALSAEGGGGGNGGGAGGATGRAISNVGAFGGVCGADAQASGPGGNGGSSINGSGGTGENNPFASPTVGYGYGAGGGAGGGSTYLNGMSGTQGFVLIEW